MNATNSTMNVAFGHQEVLFEASTVCALCHRGSVLTHPLYGLLAGQNEYEEHREGPG